MEPDELRNLVGTKEEEMEAGFGYYPGCHVQPLKKFSSERDKIKFRIWVPDLSQGVNW